MLREEEIPSNDGLRGVTLLIWAQSSSVIRPLCFPCVYLVVPWELLPLSSPDEPASPAL